VFVDDVEAMKGVAVPPLVQPRFARLARWILLKGLDWRDDERREHLAYSERELERIVRIRTMRQAKAAERKRQRAQALKEQSPR
jgi:hypothetical protein